MTALRHAMKLIGVRGASLNGRLWLIPALALVLGGLLAPPYACAQSDTAESDVANDDAIDPDFEEMIRLDNSLKKYQDQLAKEKRQQSLMVRRVQTALQALGFYYGRIDGDFGPGTEEALSTYQQSRGLYPTNFITEYDIVQLEADARARSTGRAVTTDTAAVALESPPPNQ